MGLRRDRYPIALLLRRLVPALVTMLALILILPPLTAGSKHSRWLPSRAGGRLYLPDTDPVLTSGAGGLVVLGWIFVIGVIAAVIFTTRDA